MPPRPEPSSDSSRKARTMQKPHRGNNHNNSSRSPRKNNNLL
jgi:hypothetical protein